MSRLAFIAGGSNGIGQALALRFHAARRNAEVQLRVQANTISVERCQIYSADVAAIDSIMAAGLGGIAAQGVPDLEIASAGLSIDIDSAVREGIDVMVQTFATDSLGVAATVARGSGALVGIGSVASIRGVRATALTAPARRQSSVIARACGESYGPAK